jgi:ligand-binding SRPBCC domain-containing protein
MSNHLEFEQWVPFPLERVFDFFSNPENLPRIMPAASATQLIAVNRKPPPVAPSGTVNDKAAGVGSTIVTSFRVFPLLPIRKQWVARITEFEWNHHFSDVQDKGPFHRWHHRHEFAADTREGITGTLVRDVIDYDVGFGFVGALTNKFLVRPQMEHTFAERHHKLAELLS